MDDKVFLGRNYLYNLSESFICCPSTNSNVNSVAKNLLPSNVCELFLPDVELFHQFLCQYYLQHDDKKLTFLQISELFLQDIGLLHQFLLFKYGQHQISFYVTTD
jgi:hypothetical protein